MERLAFLDRFTTIFGFKGIDDYTTRVYSSQYKNVDIILTQVNNLMPRIKQLFNATQLQLSRTDYKVETITIAFALLKNLLRQAGINYELIKSNGRSYLQLVSPNNVLREYICMKMENKFPTLCESNVENAPTIDLQNHIKYLNIATVDDGYTDSKFSVPTQYMGVLYNDPPRYINLISNNNDTSGLGIIGMINNQYYVIIGIACTGQLMKYPTLSLLYNNVYNNEYIDSTELISRDVCIDITHNEFVPTKRSGIWMFVLLNKIVQKNMFKDIKIKYQIQNCDLHNWYSIQESNIKITNNCGIDIKTPYAIYGSINYMANKDEYIFYMFNNEFYIHSNIFLKYIYDVECIAENFENNTCNKFTLSIYSHNRDYPSDYLICGRSNGQFPWKKQNPIPLHLLKANLKITVDTKYPLDRGEYITIKFKSVNKFDGDIYTEWKQHINHTLYNNKN